VRQSLPAVRVLEVPNDPSRYVETLVDSGLFEITAITHDDMARTRQYAANAERERAKNASTGLEDYLASLQMTLAVELIDKETLGRTVQLINKTNQFNLTSKRYNEAQVSSMAEQGGSFCRSLRLTDKFGDNGIISVILAVPDPNGDLAIDTWVMSCRVLKRGVEAATMNLIAEFAKTQGYKTITGEFIPTKKNAMVESHYPSLGFTILVPQAQECGSASYQLNLDDYKSNATVIAIRV
jgi:FkbH-like protein